MGNTNQRANSINSTNDRSSPPCKRAKNFNGSSISLRSLTSLSNFKDNFKLRNVTRKRKHTSITPSTSSGSIISIDRHWPSFDNFDSEFPYTSQISEADFVILNALGSGRFGRVFRAKKRSTDNQQIALKIQNKANILKANAEEQIKNEVKILKLLGKNNFVVEFFDAWQTGTELFTVMEYVDGPGDLFTLFNEYKHFSEQMTCLYSIEIALGLEFLHQNSIIFRDLKMENLSLDSNLHIKFVDFGLSKQVGPGTSAKTICGTLQFMAPELALEKPYGFAVDWWSFGVTLFVMRNGQYPFPNNYATTHKELVFDQQQDFPDTMSYEFQDLIRKLLQIDPNKRLSSASELLKQPFYENVNIEGIINKDVSPFEILKTECKSVDRLKGFDEHYKNFDFYFD